MREYALLFTQESLCRPEFRARSEITNIVERWENGGVLEHTSRYEGQYGDFTGPQSYHEAVNAVLETDGMFQSLPSAVRDRYGNDPAVFLKAVDDGDDFLVEAGILKAPKRAEPSDASKTDRSDKKKAKEETKPASTAEVSSDDG